MFCVLLRRRVVSALVGHIFFHCLEMRLRRFFYRQQPGHFPEIYVWIAYFVFNTGVSISFTRRLPADVPWKSRKKAWTYRRPRLCGSSLDFEFVTMYEINKILPKFHFLTKIEKKKKTHLVFCKGLLFTVSLLQEPFGSRFIEVQLKIIFSANLDTSILIHNFPIWYN